MAKPAIKGDEWEQQDAFVNPFFGVKETADKKADNMVMEQIVYKRLTLPVMSSVELKPHTRLLMFVKPKEAVPLRNAVVKDNDTDDDDEETPEPKAKARVNARAVERSPAPVAKKARK